MKVYRTTVRALKGSFKGRTSNLCSVTMGYKPDKDLNTFLLKSGLNNQKMING